MLYANQLFQLKIDFIRTIIAKIEASSPGKGKNFAQRLLQVVKEYKNNLSTDFIQLYHKFLALHHEVQDVLWSLNPSKTVADMYCMREIKDKQELVLLGGSSYKPIPVDVDEQLGKVEELDETGAPIIRNEYEQCMYDIGQYLFTFGSFCPTGRIPGLNAPVPHRPPPRKKSKNVVELDEQEETKARREKLREAKIKEKVDNNQGKGDDTNNEGQEDVANDEGKDDELSFSEGTVKAPDLVLPPTETPPSPPAAITDPSPPKNDNTIVMAASVIFLSLLVILIISLVVKLMGRKKVRADHQSQGQYDNHERDKGHVFRC